MIKSPFEYDDDLPIWHSKLLLFYKAMSSIKSLFHKNLLIKFKEVIVAEFLYLGMTLYLINMSADPELADRVITYSN